MRVPEQLRELENSSLTCRGVGKQLLGVSSEQLIRGCAGTWLRGHKTQPRVTGRCVAAGSAELGVPALGAEEGALASPAWIWQ